MRRIRRSIVVSALIVGLLCAAVPTSARAESSGGLDPNISIGILLVVIGAVGWVAWTIEKEDKAEQIQARAILPVYRSTDDDAAFGFVLDPKSDESHGVVLTAGLAVGRRF